MSCTPTHTIPLFSRRSLLRASLVAGGGLTVAMVAAGPAAAKMAQKAVAYQAKPKGDQRCSTCKLWEPPASCKLVEGPISADGWCNIYVKK